MTQKHNTLFLVLLCLWAGQANAFTLLLAPAGHATDPGRQLHNACERALTYEWAKAIQTNLLQRHPGAQIIISRSPGETLLPLQIVSFANRLPADLIISFHLFKQEHEKPQLYLYHHTYNPFLENCDLYQDPLAFIPLKKAHLGKKKLTLFWAKNLQNRLKSTENSCFFDCAQTQGLPFKPFYGMLYPALAFELGISKDTQWQDTVFAIINALEFLFF